MKNLSCLIVLSAVLSACSNNPQPEPGPIKPPANAGRAQLDAPLGAAVVELTEKLSAALQPIAVLEARDQSRARRPLDAYLTDELIYRLSKANVQMVERTRLASVLDEQKLSGSSLISDDEAVSIGNLVGARALLLSSYTLLKDSVALSMRLVASEKGIILGTARADLPLSAFPSELIGALAQGPTTPQVSFDLLAEDTADGPVSTRENGSPLLSYSRYRVRMVTDRTLHVYLIAVDGNGAAKLLFPGALTGLSNPVETGEYLLPVKSWFVLDEHPGREALVLLAGPSVLENIEALVAQVQASLAGPPTLPAIDRMSAAMSSKVPVIRAVHYLHR